ncbi:MAG: hypothetical protein H6873_10690 [Hyphomicrobiaceae bacterium]|nr:hypothetical protein [Hyphomicrobiaceae bacterium]
MSDQYNFNVGVFPLQIGGVGVGGHITFAIVNANSGQVAYEMNGLSTAFDENGQPYRIPIGTPGVVGDQIRGYIDMGGFLYPHAKVVRTLDQGTFEEMSYYTDVYLELSRTVNSKGLEYIYSTQNSNSFANTFLTTLGIDIPRSEFEDKLLGTEKAGGVTGFGNILLTDSELSELQGSLGIQKPHCFIAGTDISMWDGSKKPIEEIKPGDVVLSHDKNGKPVPGRVKRTFENEATHILDFWGTGVTPGHVYLCGDGKFANQYVPIIDILRTDGTVVREDGTHVRAATGLPTFHPGEQMIHATASFKRPDGSWTETKTGQIRLGTRVILPDGRDLSVLQMSQMYGWGITMDGYMIADIKLDDGSVRKQTFLFPWTFSEDLPKPEDYILQRSKVSVPEIYQANEWEGTGTRMPAPQGSIQPAAQFGAMQMQPSRPTPNVPNAFADHPDAPRLNRKQRKAREAHLRTVNKQRRRHVLN